MLPVIPAAEDRERHYARKARKRKQKDMVMSGSRDLAANRRRSTIKTETTLTESNDGDAKKESERSSYHQRDLSITVNWTKDDIERMAKELDEGVISDLDLSLFAFWIKAKHENYLFARDFVRELALDQVGGCLYSVLGLATDTCRVTMSTGSQTRMCASCCRKYTMLDQGAYLENALLSNWLQQTVPP